MTDAAQPTLHYHPFASFCQKALIALYEKAVPFGANLVDLGDPEQRGALLRIRPFGKFPVLEDAGRGGGRETGGSAGPAPASVRIAR